MNISVENLMEFYVDTLNKCGMHLLNMEDDEIRYYIFEELDISITTFLHRGNLDKLMQAGLIDDRILRMSLLLRNSFMELQSDSNCWSLDAVKSSDQWRRVFEQSDRIRTLLNQFKP